MKWSPTSLLLLLLTAAALASAEDETVTDVAVTAEPDADWAGEVRRLDFRIDDIYDMLQQWKKEFVGRIERRKEEIDHQLFLSMQEESTCRQVNETVDRLRGALKCSLGLERGRRSRATSAVEDVGQLEVILSGGQSLAIKWQWPEDGDQCRSYLTSVKLRVSRADAEGERPLELDVPQRCLVEGPDGSSHSIELPSTERHCHLPSIPLVECVTYDVELVPEYSTLSAQVWRTQITVPPKMEGDSTRVHNLTATLGDGRALTLSWAVGSEECGRILSAVEVEVAGLSDGQGGAAAPLTVDAACLTPLGAGAFGLRLSGVGQEAPTSRRRRCPPPPAAVQLCRQYTVGLRTQFGGQWTGSTVPALRVFTTSNETRNFCQLLNAPDGSFSSPAVAHGHGRNLTTTWLISVEEGRQIWLAWTRFHLEDWYEDVSVWDGAGESSPLLLQHSGSFQPASVRSSSHQLLVQLRVHAKYKDYYDNHYYQKYGYGFQARYISVEESGGGSPPACGGFIVGQGEMRSEPAVAGLTCTWYVESLSERHSLLLRSLDADASTPYSMTVSDGWSPSDAVVYRRNGTASPQADWYSPVGRIRVETRAAGGGRAWAASSVAVARRRFHLTDANGTLSTPNYPQPYPAAVDCRWTVAVAARRTVRLLFAYFDTEANLDLLTIYDGPDVYSPVLLEKSGRSDGPFTVVSSSDRLHVRFTSSPDSKSGSGFLAVYDSQQQP